MIVLLNDHEILGRLLVNEAITRRKRSNSNEELNVVNTKTEVGKNQCKPRERINYLAVKHIRNNITIR